MRIKMRLKAINSPIRTIKKYRSAQNYNDNIICICQESAYHFYEKVVDEILAMYKDAEVPLIYSVSGQMNFHTGFGRLHQFVRILSQTIRWVYPMSMIFINTI